MKLTIMERITLLQELPPHGDIASLRIMRELKENLGLGEKERKATGFREGQDWSLGCPACGSTDVDVILQSTEDAANRHCRACNRKGLNGENRLAWSFMGATDIPIGEKATDIIVGALKALNEKPHADGTKGCLEDRHISLYEKFVEGKVDVPSENGNANEPIPLKEHVKK